MLAERKSHSPDVPPSGVKHDMFEIVTPITDQTVGGSTPQGEQVRDVKNVGSMSHLSELE